MPPKGRFPPCSAAFPTLPAVSAGRIPAVDRELHAHAPAAGTSAMAGGFAYCRETGSASAGEGVGLADGRRRGAQLGDPAALGGQSCPR